MSGDTSKWGFRDEGSGCSDCFGRLVAPSNAAFVSITFDEDANGNPLSASSLFVDTVALTNEFESLGVTFSGPTLDSGGAILDVSSNFGIGARSGQNFFAVNDRSSYTNGGLATGPTTLTFSQAVDSVSIWGGDSSQISFRMDAYAGSSLVGTSTASAFRGYSQLSVIGVGPVDRVVISETSGDGTYVLDDLSFNTVDAAIPEPGSIAIWSLLALACVVGNRSIRSRRR